MRVSQIKTVDISDGNSDGSDGGDNVNVVLGPDLTFGSGCTVFNASGELLPRGARRVPNVDGDEDGDDDASSVEGEERLLIEKY